MVCPHWSDHIQTVLPNMFPFEDHTSLFKALLCFSCFFLAFLQSFNGGLQQIKVFRTGMTLSVISGCI